MSHISTARTSWARAFLAFALLALTAVLQMLPHRAAGAEPQSSAVAGPVAGVSTPSTGEQGPGTGPVTAPVDPGYASPAAARLSALAAHGLPKPAPGKVTAALDPAVFGRWTTLAYKLPLRAIHATLLR
ncbi:MAG: hypothetical protein QOF53_776, partial [Nocardioidaceae bacterium]|nr:hypothetical protein [Nocardioidaceae bacterium]